MKRAPSIFAISLLLACGRGAAHPTPPPKSFLFGAAIAGFQVDLGCPSVPAAQCEDRASDWYAWITRPEIKADAAMHIAGTPPSGGPGFFELYPQDLDRAAGELHGNALRLSIEWSRVFPVSTVGVRDLRSVASPSALAYYHAVFAAMKARGLVPLVTLNHYTLPAWLHDAVGCHQSLAACSPRGWLEPYAPEEAARYAGFVAGEFPEVRLWATLNEPFTAVIVSGYLAPSEARSSPPGAVLQWTAAKAVLNALVTAHAAMVDAVRAAAPLAQVGIVYNIQATAPKDPSRPGDVRAAKDLAYLMNQVFLDAVAKGDFDGNLDGHPQHRRDLEGRLDFLGVNYYIRAVVEGVGSSLFPEQSPFITFNPLTLDLRTEASGLGEVLDFARGYGKPIYITETGVEDAHDVGKGAQWVVDTLAQLRGAIDRGADVRGYFYWTLMDNFEWNHGMTMQYGLYAVDAADPLKRRVARPRVIAAMADGARAWKIPAEP